MIKPNDQAVQELRRIDGPLYEKSSTQKMMMGAMTVGDTFNRNNLGPRTELLAGLKHHEIELIYRDLKRSCNVLGLERLRDLLATPYPNLCETPSMTAKSMAFLLDFVVAFDLMLEGAPPPPLERPAAAAKVAS